MIWKVLTVYIAILGSFGEDLPQGFVFRGIPFHLQPSLVLVDAERKDGVLLTDGGSTKSPRGKGSLMKTVYDGSDADIVARWWL